MISESSEVVKLLKFAFRFAVHFHDIQNVAKVPFSMIEDIMESQTIEKAEALWQIIESLVEVITQPDIFPKGNFSRCNLHVYNAQNSQCLLRLYYVISFIHSLPATPCFTFFIGKLTILRTCNSLLRKLSKSCNTEVHLKQAQLFPNLYFY